MIKNNPSYGSSAHGAAVKPGIEQYTVTPQQTVRDAIAVIDKTGIGAALIVTADRKLVGIVTDGDIRRAVLKQMDLDQPVDTLLSGEREFGRLPLSANVNAPRSELIGILNRYHIRHLPLIDGEGRLVQLATREELLGAPTPTVRALIMAGGFGTRLKPLTDYMPKPMLPLGDKPILQRIIEQLRQHGIEDIAVSVHYKKEIIQDYFRDGRDFGVNISYVVETEPRGTGGAIGELEFDDNDDRLILVTNGDILSSLSFELMERFHRQNKAKITMAVAAYQSVIPYGVVEMDEPRVVQVTEKPSTHHFINAGVYLIDRDQRRLIPSTGMYNMTDLIADSLKAGDAVVGFPVREYWRDIGRHDDYRRANRDVEDMV